MESENVIVKEYEINESILVTYHTLNSLYQSFFAMYPSDISNEVVELINHLNDLLEQGQTDFPNYDIENSNYFERVIYIKNDYDKDSNVKD